MTKQQRSAYNKTYWKNRSPEQIAAIKDRRNKREYRRAGAVQKRVWTLWERHGHRNTATVVELEKLFEDQHGICPLTGRSITYATADLDHIVPISKGGSGTIENLRWVHRHVNQMKWNFSDEQFDAVCVDRARMLGMTF